MFSFSSVTCQDCKCKYERKRKLVMGRCVGGGGRGGGQNLVDKES